MRKNLLLVFLCIFALQALAQAPAGYYDKIDSKKKEELKTALHQIIRDHVSMGYDTYKAQFWGDVYFKQTDWNPGGYYWDMYSNEHRVTYNSSSMAREHCLPRSWWQDLTTDQYGDGNNDILNLYPSDSYTNSKKSNWPLGEVGITTYDNGVVKLGQNTYGSDYTGTAFEPADEYKGDFARTYFYMVTCYEDYANRWNGDGLKMLNNNTYPVLKDWALNMLLQWHRDDPVSQKEIDRNNAVFGMQFNRNPFIDYPDLVEYIWGNDMNNNFIVPNKATVPALLTPTLATNLNFGTKTQNINPSVKEVLVRGVLLTNPISVSVSGQTSNFSVQQSVISAADAINGYRLPVQFLAGTEGSYSATLRLTSDEIGTVDIPLTGEYKKGEAVAPIEPSEDMDVMIFYKGPWKQTDLPIGFTVKVSSDPYTNGDLAFKKSNENLVVKFDEEPDLMQFAIKPNNAWGVNQNHLYVYESVDGASWGLPIADFDNGTGTLNSSGNYYNTPEIYLTQTTRAIKIEYVKVAQNVGVNNLIITRKQNVDIFENLVDNDLNLYVKDGRLYIPATMSGLPIAIYNLTGRLVYSGKTTGNEDIIDLYGRGVHIVRVGAKAYKILN